MRGRLRNVGLLAVVLGVLLAGCGGDDSPGSRTATTNGTATANGTASTAPQRTAPEKTSTAKEKPRRERTAGAGGSTADTGGAGAKDDAAGDDETAPTNKKRKRQPSTTKDEMSLVRRNLYKQAREVCKTLTLDGLAREYKVKSGKPSDVAETYAASYSTTVRPAVEAGCKRGLLDSK